MRLISKIYLKNKEALTLFVDKEEVKYLIRCIEEGVPYSNKDKTNFIYINKHEVSYYVIGEPITEEKKDSDND